MILWRLRRFLEVVSSPYNRMILAIWIGFKDVSPYALWVILFPLCPYLIPCNTHSVFRGDKINLFNFPTWFPLWWLCIGFLWVETFHTRRKCIKTRKRRKQLRSLKKSLKLTRFTRTLPTITKIVKQNCWGEWRRQSYIEGVLQLVVVPGGDSLMCKTACRLYRKTLQGCGLLNLPVLDWAFGHRSCLANRTNWFC